MTKLSAPLSILLLLVLAACTTGPTPTAISTGAAPAGVTPTGAMPSYSQTTESTLASPPDALPAGDATTAADPHPKSTRASDLDPLTGLKPDSPELLDRRPVIVKIQNLPRPREQWGVSAADLVYEYYTEEGSTRFSAVFYGSNPDMVAPIRSARWFDMHLIRMYGANFVFGSAYSDLLHALF